MITRASISCVAMVLALACAGGASRIDASSSESTEASIERIQNGLSEEKRDQFSVALATVIAHALGGGYRDVGDTPEGRARVRAALNGKSADEIIAAAEQIRSSAGAEPSKGS